MNKITMKRYLEKEPLVRLATEWNLTSQSLVNIRKVLNSESFLQQRGKLVKQLLSRVLELAGLCLLLVRVLASRVGKLDGLAHQTRSTQTSEVGELVLKVLESVIPGVLALVPGDQTLKPVVGVLALALYVVAGRLQEEEDLIAGQHHAVAGPVCLAAELVQHRAVLLRLDQVRVLRGDQGAGGEVTRPLRGRVPDVQLEAVLGLGSAAGGVKLN